MNFNSDETIDAIEAARLCHCDPQTIEILARRGELPAVKVGRGWTFLRTQLLEALAERAIKEAARRRGDRSELVSADAPASNPIGVILRRGRGRPRIRPPAVPVPDSPFSKNFQNDEGDAGPMFAIKSAGTLTRR